MKAKDLFSFFQLLFLFFLGGSVLLFWFRNRTLGSSGDPFEDERRKLKQQLLKTMMDSRSKPDQQSRAANIKAQKKSASAQVLSIASVFPSWSAQTPAHEVLGLTIGASSELIEDSYRRKVKLYHPDRFQSWGKDYATRAHEILILLQKAREKMLLGK